MTTLLARLSQHGPTPAEAARPLDLLQIATRIAAARRAQHSVEVDGGSVIAHADAQALETMLGHLVQNAVEASAPDTPVRLHVLAEGGRAVIEVRDRGRGMTPAFVRDCLFRPFASAKPDGFGLGAYEARQLAEQMGGSIIVNSSEGEGTCFRVALPLVPALEQAA